MSKCLSLSTPVRWPSSASFLGALEENKAAIQAALMDDRLPADIFSSDLRADLIGELWKEHQDAAEITKSITSACILIFAEADDAALSPFAAALFWLAIAFAKTGSKVMGDSDRKKLCKMLRRRLFGSQNPRDRRNRAVRSFHHCLALAFMLDPLFDNLRARGVREFGSIRLGRREWLTNAVADGGHEGSIEDIAALGILYIGNNAARSDPNFAAELLDACNQPHGKQGPLRASGALELTDLDMHPLNAFSGGVELEAASVIA